MQSLTDRGHSHEYTWTNAVTSIGQRQRLANVRFIMRRHVVLHVCVLQRIRERNVFLVRVLSTESIPGIGVGLQDTFPYYGWRR